MLARSTFPWTLGLGAALMASGVATVALQTIPSLQLVHRYAVMAAAFIPYGLPAFAGAAAVFATSPKRWVRPFAVAALAGVALQVWWARPYWPAAPASGTGSVTLLTMNMRGNARGIADLADVVLRTRPDVVVVEGLWRSERDKLGQQWARLLPHSTFHPLAALPGCGTFVFSRTPLRELSDAGATQPVVEVDLPDGPLVVLPVDLPTPTEGVAPWLDAFTHLTDAATAHRGSPVVVAGDFNAVREHAPMRQLLRDTGLRDAAEVAGAGWTPTFPARSWHPPLIGLDHVLLGDGLAASGVRTEGVTGQEHRALLVVTGRTPH